MPSRMKVGSFVRSGLGLEPVELEISLVPGLPSIKFLGLPGPMIREGEIRLKAAIKGAGFEFPKTKQLIVQIRPLTEKRESRGLDLAVAYGYLVMTNQVKPLREGDLYLYGEVSLFGDVLAPVDIADLGTLDVLREKLVTGDSKFSNFSIQNLKDLSSEQIPQSQIDFKTQLSRPPLESRFVTRSQARLAAAAALGRHPVLMVGSPGTGKSTLAQTIHQIQTDPEPEEFRISQQVARAFGETVEWRPLRGPHPTSSVRSMVGGGNPPVPGEISRAHGGTLILDEFLEFDPQVQEALREPMETGHVLISRAGNSGRFPARFLLIATSNLCPCGHLNPKNPDRCNCRNQRRGFYLEKLSGPIVDRFDLICPSDPWSDEELSVPVDELAKLVHRGSQFRKKRMSVPPVEVPGEAKGGQILGEIVRDLRLSRRRQASLLKLARTLADLDGSKSLRPGHVRESYELAYLGGVTQLEKVRALF